MQSSSIHTKLNREVSKLLKKSDYGKNLPKSEANISYDDFISNKLLLVMMIRQGIPYSLFKLIREITPFTEKEWAEIFNISAKSLQRYSVEPDYTFKSIYSEKILEIAEVINVGNDIFGNSEKFNLWLETPNFALGNMKPLELLKDSYGKELVLAELVRIEHGILS
ncbi:MAG: DUF2384 domain-containing protein [Saprospiraceae bacterium]|nr:DUF2384 domain-containing protein [Saprospiraceae bacterium]